MSCQECNDRGFVLQSGDFRTYKRSYQKTEFVVRCPLYLDYFKIVRSIDDEPVSGAGICGAAKQRHELARDRRSGGKKRKGGGI